MRLISVAILVIAFLLTLALLPATYVVALNHGRDGNPAGVGIAVLGVFRAIALIAAFLFLAGEGRLAQWAPSVAGRVALVIIGILSLEVSIGVLQFLAIDYRIQMFPRWIFGILGVALPLSVIAAGYWCRRPLFVGAVLTAVATAGSGVAFYDLLTAKWNQERAEAPIREEKRKQQRLAALHALPADGPAERLLDFVSPGEQPDARAEALRKLGSQQEAVRKLLPLPEGPRRLRALYVVLQYPASSLPPAALDECWTAAEALATAFNRTGGPMTKDEAEMLSAAGRQLAEAGRRHRGPRREALKAIRDFIRSAESKGLLNRSQDALDFYLEEADRVAK